MLKSKNGFAKWKTAISISRTPETAFGRLYTYAFKQPLKIEARTVLGVRRTFLGNSVGSDIAVLQSKDRKRESFVSKIESPIIVSDLRNSVSI